MSMPRRLPPTTALRDLIVERHMNTGALRGHSRLIAPATVQASLGDSRVGTGRGVSSIKGHEEVLKTVGESPGASYELTFVPIRKTVHLIAGGVPISPNGLLYSVAGKTITIEAALGLHEDDELWARYLYEYANTLEDLPPTIEGALYELSYNYTYDFQLPSTSDTGDLMIAAWGNWHGWGVNSAEGWAQWYNNGSNTNVVCAKFIDTEVPGDIVHPSSGGQGYRAAGQMVIVRGVDQGAPLHQITTGGGAISTGSEQRIVVHMLEHIGGGNPTIDRGDEIQNAFDGNMAIRATSEVVAAGQVISAVASGGFLASIALAQA